MHSLDWLVSPSPGDPLNHRGHPGQAPAGRGGVGQQKQASVGGVAVMVAAKYEEIYAPEVPSCLKIDHNKVKDLKSLMVSNPDKTQIEMQRWK